MAADSRVCEGATGLLHTVAFTALLTCSPGIEQSQGSRSWGHFCSHNPLLHPQSPAPSSQSQACPILCPFLTSSQVSCLQFSKSQCKPGSYQVFMEDPCHSILAKWNWKRLPLSSLRVWETWGVALNIKHLPDTSGHPSQRENLCCVEFLSFLPQGSKHSQIHAKSSLGGMDWLIQYGLIGDVDHTPMVLLPMCPCWRTLGLVEVQGGRKGPGTRGEKWGKKREEIVGERGKRGHGQRSMETVTAWRRNRLSRPHLWSHVDNLRVATGCWRSETHFFIAEMKLWGPWGKYSRGPKARLWGASGSPGHILTLSLPFAFPQPLHMTAALRHQTSTWQMMKIQRQWARILRSFISSSISFKNFIFLWSIDSSL